MIGALARIVAAEIGERTVRRVRERQRLTCRECGNDMWGGTRARPKCANPRCPTGRRNRDQADTRARRARDVRQPPRNPRPAHGTCTLCRGPVIAPRRTWCSEECVKTWRLATTRDVQATHLRAIFDGCWKCGAREADPTVVWSGPLEVDHVRPLWSLTDVERTELRWWLPENLQLLCPRDHKAKTKREAGERARARA